MARLYERYKKEIVPEYMKRFNYKNVHRVPRLKKIIVSIGINEAKQDAKTMESLQGGLAKITGQWPVIRKAKKAVAGFKLKKGSPCGCMVTLRRARMYEFFDRLINVAMPRIRDFQGLPNKSFDEGGNYSFGIKEQMIFPEIDVDKTQITHGMNITIVTDAGSKERAYELLKMFRVPFKKR
jgi:large subunit ribosomal protein L5